MFILCGMRRHFFWLPVFFIALGFASAGEGKNTNSAKTAADKSQKTSKSVKSEKLTFAEKFLRSAPGKIANLTFGETQPTQEVLCNI